MPAQFDACVSSGGRVRTKSLSGGKYIHICFKDGKSYAGEVKTTGKGGGFDFIGFLKKLVPQTTVNKKWYGKY